MDKGCQTCVPFHALPIISQSEMGFSRNNLVHSHRVTAVYTVVLPAGRQPSLTNIVTAHQGTSSPD